MSEAIARPLPHSPEAERAVLGTAVLNAEAFLGIVPILRPEDLFLPQNRAIYKAMQSLIGTGQPINLVLLMETLGETGELEAAGGAPYISQIGDGMFRVTHAEHYAKVVRLFWSLGLAFERKADAPSYWKQTKVRGTDGRFGGISAACKARALEVKAEKV